MIKRSTDIITKIKAFVYDLAELRIACYLLIAAALLLIYIFAENGGVSFVYNEF